MLQWFLNPFCSKNQDNMREIIASADCGPSLFTLGMMLSGDISFTNSLSSAKLQCSLYGTSYLTNKENFVKLCSFKEREQTVLPTANLHLLTSSVETYINAP